MVKEWLVLILKIIVLEVVMAFLPNLLDCTIQTFKDLAVLTLHRTARKGIFLVTEISHILTIH